MGSVWQDKNGEGTLNAGWAKRRMVSRGSAGRKGREVFYPLHKLQLCLGWVGWWGKDTVLIFKWTNDFIKCFIKSIMQYWVAPLFRAGVRIFKKYIWALAPIRNTMNSFLFYTSGAKAPIFFTLYPRPKGRGKSIIIKAFFVMIILSWNQTAYLNVKEENQNQSINSNLCHHLSAA